MVEPLRVFVVGGGYLYIQMFYEAGFVGARSVEDADIICFTGGEDVDPSLYGEQPLNTTNYNPRRDSEEMVIFADAAALGKPMVGICRGGQFLNVMNGGKMWQHVNNHAGRNHSVVDSESGRTVPDMTSTHHQMMIMGDSGIMLAQAQLCTYRQNDKETIRCQVPELNDAEAIWYAQTNCLCFQPHPEYHKGACRDYFFELFNKYIVYNNTVKV